MSWIPNATVTIDGAEYSGAALNGVTVSVGRASIWEQARAGYCQIQIVTFPNDFYYFDINDPVTISVEDSNGDPITIFTGTLTTVNSVVGSSGTIENVVISTITGIGVMSKMSRVLIGGSWPKEYDDDRMDRILTASGVPIETIDTPGVYEFMAINKDLGDSYSYAAYYAQMAFGYIYETAAGEIGYANESRRSAEVQSNGYFHIEKNTILGRSVSSQISLADLMNDLTLTYKNSQTVTATSASSIANYGEAGASINTELEDTDEAQNQADRYITLRSTPQINLNSFVVQLDAPTVTSAALDKLLEIYLGLPIQIQNLPPGILGASGGTFNGFVESWIFNISQKQASLTINASDSTYSLAPTRWQDVSPSLVWSAIDPALQWQDYE